MCVWGLFVIQFVPCLGFYEDVSAVTHLDQDNFNQIVIESPSIWMVQFYAPWCTYSKNFQSEFKKVVERREDIIRFGAVDCDVETNKPVCGHFGITELPTLLLFKSHLEVVMTEGKKILTKKPLKYEGDMHAEFIVKWITSFLVDPFDPLIDVTDVNYLRRVYKQTHHLKNKAIYFTDKESKSNMMRSLALQFRPDSLTNKWIVIGQVNHTQTDLVSQFQIESFPSLIIIDETGKKVATFKGEYKAHELYEFLKEHAHEVTKSDLLLISKATRNLYQINDQESFDIACSQKDVCLIAFLDSQSEDHQEYITTLGMLMEEQPSQVQLLWMEGDSPRIAPFLKEFGVASGFPQAIAYQRNTKRFKNFLGSFTEEQLDEFLDLFQSSTKKSKFLKEEPKILTEQKEEL
uniref:Thioredoxin domain-containing protein n=1 Tax=Arcella intermedia TaxID=1963864 RepID=A0A6B2L657_9EUKA